MTKIIRSNFTPKFRLESAQLFLDQGYSVKEAVEAMNIDKSTIDKWVRQLQDERDEKAASTFLRKAINSLDVKYPPLKLMLFS